jgi:two-component system LytT family sensor kinase
MLKQFLYRYKFHHLLFWVILFGAWYFFRYQDFNSAREALLMIFIRVIDLALMVYLVNYLLIPKLLYKKRYVWFGISFFVLITTSSLFKIYLLHHLLSPGVPFTFFDRSFKVRVYDNMIPHFLLVSTGAAFKLLLDYAKAQRRMGELAREKAEAELGFLKSQINPHFLFNSINSVYFLIDKSNTAARDALHRFSDMLRYQLYEVKGEKIPVEKEISFIKDYIDLQRLRKEANCAVKFNIDEHVHGFSIEPLLLVPFVENSFKHLSHYSNGRMNEIKIDLSRSNNEMRFMISNTTEGQQVDDVKQDGGIGLPNVKRRLELLYPQKHVLDIRQHDEWFDVELRMKIDNTN